MYILGEGSGIDGDIAIFDFSDFDKHSDTIVEIDDNIIEIKHTTMACDIHGNITHTGKEVRTINIDEVEEIQLWEKMYIDGRHCFPGHLKIIGPGYTELLYYTDKTEPIVSIIAEYMKAYIELGETEVKL